MDSDIEKLKRDLEQVQRDVAEINKKLPGIEENASTYLDRYIDSDSKNIIAKIISERIPVIWWDEIFYISSVFESIDRLLVTGSVTSTSDGLSLDSTGATATGILSQTTNSPIAATKELLMSTTVKIAAVANAALLIDVVSSGTAQVRMKVEAGVIKGVCTDGTNTTTITLGTAANAQILSLELHYFPGTKVDFYVNDVLTGTITQYLPPTTTSVDRLIGYSLEKVSGGGAATTALVTYMSLLQKTK